jgi:hypothetical protein
MEWGGGEDGCKEESDIKLNFRMNKKTYLTLERGKIIWVHDTR